MVDGHPAKPEDVFGTPAAFLQGRLIRREGKSYHLPNGGALYFDTGVIEVATPAIEIAAGCGARAGRSLWEGITTVRDDLDAWEARTGRNVRLVGFSAHYNVSFDAPDAGRSPNELAWLLAHLLPAPIMLLATNRASTGVGIRPRPGRMEVTVDFTPSPALSIATAAFLTAVIREVASWPDYGPDALHDRGLPFPEDLKVIPHTSRKGWLAKGDHFGPVNPFQINPDHPAIRAKGRMLSLREMAGQVYRAFLPAIHAITNPFTAQLLHSLFLGNSPTLLHLPERPAAYEDVGRACRWEALFPANALSRSRYEHVLIRAVRGDRLLYNNEILEPVKPEGWTQVLFLNPARKAVRLSVDALSRPGLQWLPAAP